MAVLAGQFVGGCIAIFLLSQLIGRFLFTGGAPTGRALRVSATAWVMAAILAGFGMADADGFSAVAGGYYLLPAIAMFFLIRRRYRRAPPPIGDIFR